MKKASFRVIFTYAALILAAPLILSAQDSQRPVATVDGQPIYEQDLMSVAGPSLLELRNQEYKVKREALDKLILKKLVEAEAKKKGVTAEEFLQQEVDSKVAAPSDEEAKGYYLAGKNQTTLPFDQIKSQIKQLLKNSETQQAREKYADSLRTKTEVAVLLRPPTLDVAYDPVRVKGDPKAPVTIVEFADFQCPFCKKTEATLKEVLAKYNGRVKLAYRDFPLREIHPHAEKAAEGARCAGEQGKFWEYHDTLLEDQSKLDEAGLVQRAARLKLDEKAFQACLASGKFKDKVEADLQEGTKAGVVGTPGFFIDGVFLNGAQPEAEFEKIIDTELAATGGWHGAH
jgi:protein-disulfide isomerase